MSWAADAPTMGRDQKRAGSARAGVTGIGAKTAFLDASLTLASLIVKPIVSAMGIPRPTDVPAATLPTRHQ
jgi:hypothetical protein